MLVALIEFDKEELLAGLLLFRLLYYVIPFALSLMILGLRELWLGIAAQKETRVGPAVERCAGLPSVAGERSHWVCGSLFGRRGGVAAWRSPPSDR